MTPSSIRVLDLFAGAGGLSTGFRTASSRFRTVGAVEADPAAAASFEWNFGQGIVFNGLIEEWLVRGDVPGVVDVVVGGPPCQGFSTLGKRDAEDARNSLWRQYAETLRRTRPRYFVVENVAVFLRSEQFEQLRRATSRGGLLEDYDFEAHLLDSADFGAPQSRKRAVLIGRHRDVPAPPAPERTHSPLPAPGTRPHVTVREAFAGVPRDPDMDHMRDGRSIEFGGRRYPGAFTPRQMHWSRTYTELSMRRFASIPEGGNRFDIDAELLAPCWVKHRSGSGDVMGRLRWDRPSVTIRTEFFKPEKGRYLHPVENRAITHYEAAILQGFPPDHGFVGSKTSIARQIGNAVPVPLAAAVAKTIVDTI